MSRAVNIREAEYDVYIGRPGRGLEGPFGNPFRVGVDGEQGECVDKFRVWFHSPAGKKMRDLVKERIRPGDRLGCFCKPRSCHGDVIAVWVNQGYPDPSSR